MTVVGNHDVSCHATTDLGCPKEQRNFSAYRYRFRMPSVESGAYVPKSPRSTPFSATTIPVNTHHNMWHSWRVGHVHFVAVSTESDFPHAPTGPHTHLGGGAGGGFAGNQLAWLRADLAAAAADPDVRWIVAVGHRPWYTSASIDWPLLAPHRIQESFEPLLHEFGVDLWLCGHKHFYERSKLTFTRIFKASTRQSTDSTRPRILRPSCLRRSWRSLGYSHHC